MEDLIRALQIFLKYSNEKYPTSCDHDVFRVHHISKSEVSAEDLKTLEELSFDWHEEDEHFFSYRFGNC